MDNFMTVATNNTNTLGLDSAQMNQFTDHHTHWINSLQAQRALRNLAKGATLLKNQTRQTTESYVRQWCATSS